MTKSEAINLINQGRRDEWNIYRQQNREWKPDLSYVQFPDTNLRGFNLSNADLRGADLSKSNFKGIWNVIQITGARYSLKTKWPMGFKPSVCGAMLVSDEPHLQAQPCKVFLSYAWTDKSLVLAIDQWLRNKGLETKIDERDFFAGSRIRDEILRVMKSCDAVVIFYSEASATKPWPDFEREMAADLEMEAKKDGKIPPRIIYVVLGKIELPSLIEKNRIAVMSSGKRFPNVCEEIYRGALGLPRDPNLVDLNEWENYEFS